MKPDSEAGRSPVAGLDAAGGHSGDTAHSANSYLRREYRGRMGSRFRSFVVAHRETDLWIGVDPASWEESMGAFVFARAVEYRAQLAIYGASRPEFLASFSPIPRDAGAPPVAALMMEAAAAADVGPMAAVAGAVARFVGEDLQREFGAREILVENGGDIWLLFESPVDIAVFAGNSPLSERVGLSLPPGLSPCGVCTSSGTVGPSFSYGAADAAMVVCRDAALADAWATAAGNLVTTEADIEPAITRVGTKPGIISVLVVKNGRMGIRGELPLKVFNPDRA